MLDDALRAYLHGRDPQNPPFWDLVARWDLAREAPNPAQSRGLLLIWWCAASKSERWAWDGLRKLLRTLLERPERTPQSLKVWALDVASGRLPRPPTPVGRPAEDERNVRIYYTFQFLQLQGVSRKRALEKIGKEMHRSPKTIDSAQQRARDKGLVDE